MYRTGIQDVSALIIIIHDDIHTHISTCLTFRTFLETSYGVHLPSFNNPKTSRDNENGGAYFEYNIETKPVFKKQ